MNTTSNYSDYVVSLLATIAALDTEIKYLPLLSESDLDALVAALEVLYNRVDYERTRRLLTAVRRAS